MPEAGRRGFDPDAVAEALRALGMLYGSKESFVAAAAGAADEEAAIRAYLARERAHLLKSYDVETLVRLVREAIATGWTGAPGVERFAPD